MFNPMAMIGAFLGGLNPQNMAFNQFGGFGNFNSQFQNFANQIPNPQQFNPQQMVQNMLDSGQMTQEQFNQLRMMANQITGQNR